MRPELKPVEGLSLSDMAPQEVNIPDYTVTLVPENYINTVWDDAKPLLMGGVDKSNDRWSIETLYYALMQGEQHMWVAFDEDKNITSVLTTQFITYPTKLSLAIQFAGGLEGQTSTSIFDCVLDKLERFAAESGCTCVEFWGRKGFAPWMREAGYEETSVFYEKDISHGW